MSRTMHLGCKTCHEQIWIGQNDAFYSGMPEVMKGLRLFLIKHRTGDAMTPSDDGEGDDFEREHELIYSPELYGEEWTEVDTDQFQPTQESK